MQEFRLFHLTCNIVDISSVVGTAHHHRVSEWNRNRVFHPTCDIIDMSSIVGTAHHHRVSKWNSFGSFIQPVIC